jgi:hypothetical protein
MKAKAWVLMPHTIRKGDNGIEIENEILPLVMCCDCKHYSQPQIGYSKGECLIKAGYFPVKPDWFCADGERSE